MMQPVFQTLISTYCQSRQLPVPDLTALSRIYDAPGVFREKWSQLNTWMDDHQELDELEPYLFDLLVASFVSLENALLPDGYFDSPEWAEIEEETADCGSEWLNLLIYLEDCRMNEMEPDVEDFLNEFLLVEEDGFQDEYEIYESFIVLQGLVGESEAEILKASRQSDSGELGPLLLVMLLFFSGSPGDISEITPIERALLKATVAAREMV